MKILSKKIVCEEGGRPVEARVDYEEFLRMERAADKPESRSAYERMMSFEGKVRWNEDPVAYQRRLRDEWD